MQEFCRALGVTLPVSSATLPPEWEPLLALYAESVRVLIPNRYWHTIEAFLAYKKRVGSEASRRFFARFEMVYDYIPRLIEKRPAAFFGKSWTTILRDGSIVPDAHEVYERQQDGAPVSLEEYITLEEAQIAALLVVSAPTVWLSRDGSQAKQGIAVGITAPRLQEPCLFDGPHMLVEKKNGCGQGAANGVKFNDITNEITDHLVGGASRGDESHWQHLWAHAYRTAMETIPSSAGEQNEKVAFFPDAVPAGADPGKYVQMSDKETFLNTEVYGKRVAAAVETFLLDCEYRSKVAGMPAAALIDRAIFISESDPDWELKERCVIDGIVSTLMKYVFKRVSLLRLVGFSAKACYVWYKMATIRIGGKVDDAAAVNVFHPKVEIVVTPSENEAWRAILDAPDDDDAFLSRVKDNFGRHYFDVLEMPSTSLDAPLWMGVTKMLLCAAYALTVNAMPGNTLWAARDFIGPTPTFPLLSVAAEVVTPTINASITLRQALDAKEPTAKETTLDRLYMIGERYHQYANNIAEKRDPYANIPSTVSLGYGELAMESVEGIMGALHDTSRANRSGVFYDIGSGTGILGLHAHFSLGLKVAGIEYSSDRVALSSEIMSILMYNNKGLEDALTNDVKFYPGDATAMDFPVDTVIAYSFDILHGPNLAIPTARMRMVSDGDATRLVITLSRGDYELYAMELVEGYKKALASWTKFLEGKAAACPTCKLFITGYPPAVAIKQATTIDVQLFTPSRFRYIKTFEKLRMTGEETVDLYLYEVQH